MAYYTALIAAWNGATQPPTGVTGTGLLAGDTTAQKIAKVNAWTIAGPALVPDIPISTIIGAIAPADLLALTSIQLQQLQFLLQSNNFVLAPIGGTVRSVFSSIFSGKTTTLNALAALVANYDSPQIPWTTASNGGALNGPVSQSDCSAAGLS